MSGHRARDFQAANVDSIMLEVLKHESVLSIKAPGLIRRSLCFVCILRSERVGDVYDKYPTHCPVQI